MNTEVVYLGIKNKTFEEKKGVNVEKHFWILHIKIKNGKNKMENISIGIRTSVGKPNAVAIRLLGLSCSSLNSVELCVLQQRPDIYEKSIAQIFIKSPYF
jgi:hypothetical protein